jgi:hypothetical protein
VTENARDARRVVPKTSVGHAYHSVTGNEESGITRSIALERRMLPGGQGGNRALPNPTH